MKGLTPKPSFAMLIKFFSFCSDFTLRASGLSLISSTMLVLSLLLHLVGYSPL